MKKSIFLILPLFLFYACSEKTPSGKKHNLFLKFKQGATKEYHGFTKLYLDSIKITGLSESFNKEMLQLTGGKGLQNVKIDLRQEYITVITQVKEHGSGEIETTTTTLILEDLKFNEKPIGMLSTPFRIPISNTPKPLKIELSKKGKLINFKGRKDIKALLGLKGKKLFKELIDLANSYQQLPDHKVAVGDSWDYQINKNIPLDELLSDSQSGEGSLTVSLKLKNRLNKIDGDFFYIDYQFSGDIALNLAVKDGKEKTEFSLKIVFKKAQGDVSFDNTVGLTQSAKIISDFDLFMKWLPPKKYRDQLGQPEVSLTGKVSYTLGPKTITQ